MAEHIPGLPEDVQRIRTNQLRVGPDIIEANLPIVGEDGEQRGRLEIFKVKLHPRNPMLFRLYGRFHHGEGEEPTPVTDMTLPQDSARIVTREKLLANPDEDTPGLKSPTLWKLLGSAAVVSGIIGIEAYRRKKRH